MCQTDNEHTAAEINGRSIANEIKATLATQVSNMKNSINKVPGLGVILVGKRKDSRTFVRIKKKACEQVGIASVVTELPDDCTESEVLDAVSMLNHNESIHGILVQLPLPNVNYSFTLSFAINFNRFTQCNCLFNICVRRRL